MTYTPTTEQVRWAYIADFVWHAHDAGADFDRWLEAHDREVKAQALEEAADAIIQAGWTPPPTPAVNPTLHN